MVDATFYGPVNMNHFTWTYGLPTSVGDLTKTSIRMIDGTDTAIYGGSYSYGYFVPDGATAPGDKLGVVDGTWSSYNYYHEQVLWYSFDNISFDAKTALIYIQLGQDKQSYNQELLHMVFSGNDVIQGSPFNDTLHGFAGDDYLSGGARQDHIFGGAGNDTLDGGAGRDKLIGGHGTDVLMGGDGKDVLTGALGHDTLTGGAGSDTFNFNNIAQVRGDVIQDFHQGQHDHIDFSHISGLTFIGDAAFSDTAGEIAVTHIGGNTQVRTDSTGDGHFNAQLTLIGNIDLHASDFLL